MARSVRRRRRLIAITVSLVVLNVLCGVGAALAHVTSTTTPVAPSVADTPPAGPSPDVPPEPVPVAADSTRALGAAAPRPEPAPVLASLPSTTRDPLARAQAALDTEIPASWRSVIGARLKVIAGSTSYASSRGEISIGSYHASGRWSHLESVVAHEFGHLIAYRFGTGAYGGAPPAGWPDPGWGATAEEWADCVSLAFTGIVDPSYGMPPCDGDSLSWTQSYLAAGPG